MFLEAFSFKVLNPFPYKPWFLRVYSKSIMKTLCEKEKLLVTNYDTLLLIPAYYTIDISKC